MCLRSASNFVVISSLVVKLFKNAGFGSEWDTLYNHYGHIQRTWDTTWFKTAFPRTRGLHFLPIRKRLGLVRTLTCSLSAHDSLLIFYSILVRPKLDFASIMCNSIMSTDGKQPERVQRNFLAFCQTRFSTQDQVPYEDFRKPLILRCTKEDFISMFYYLFLFILISNVALFFGYCRCCSSSS
jgi:hypothetical protein